MAAYEVVVGRQPIFDADLEVAGYELLSRNVVSRDGTQETAGVVTTSSLLYDSVRIGVRRLVGDKVLFCDADREVITTGLPFGLPPDNTVLEVSADLEVDDALVAGCEKLVAQGFRLALDHVRSAELDPRLASLVSIVKVEQELAAAPDFAAVIASFGSPPPILVALGVETREDLDRGRSFGFVYFQGGLLSRPQVIPGKALDSASAERLTLAAQLAADETSAAELEEVIRGEPAVVYHLLQMAALGAAHGTRREVRSLREALVLLGWERIRSWLSFLLMTQHGTTSEEEIVTTLARARMCELLAEQLYPPEAGLAYTAGMVSAFDVLLEMPIEDVVESLAIDDATRGAALRDDSSIGRIVADVVDCQLGVPVTGERSGASEMQLHGAAITALAWALDVVRAAEAATEDGFGEPETGAT